MDSLLRGMTPFRFAVGRVSSAVVGIQRESSR
ncbi:receptor kinase-like protein Xa21 [Iris pallida]|uniref:Receptor kinase-like protein Xa21 n=1 Tax=Iris pallida TaxID=29817 RepID=A0AAX6FXU3_IRIPA|nr:receptor kinase-like protein Xa21 [Iris pallida]